MTAGVVVLLALVIFLYSDSFLVIGATLLLSGLSLFFLPKSHAMEGGLPAE